MPKTVDSIIHKPTKAKGEISNEQKKKREREEKIRKERLSWVVWLTYDNVVRVLLVLSASPILLTSVI